MSAIMAAKIRGASPIVAIDLAEDRLILAKELGATHTLNGKEQPNELIEQIRQLAPLPAGIKHAFDTTGVPKVIETLIEATGVRGTTVVVGATPFDKTISIQPLKFLDMGKRFIGSVEGDSDPAVVRNISI
jgi:aryl-alcohol dehydrogenase